MIPKRNTKASKLRSNRAAINVRKLKLEGYKGSESDQEVIIPRVSPRVRKRAQEWPPPVRAQPRYSLYRDPGPPADQERKENI